MTASTSKPRWRVWLLPALLVATTVAWGVLRWQLGTSVAVATVVQRDFVQTVVASGHVEAPHRVDIGAQITAAVVRVPVAEGQTVKAGEVLVVLDATELQAAQRQAEVAVVQAQAHLRQLREVQAPVAEQALRQAQATLDNARAQELRNRDLFRQGFVGQAALDDSAKALALADAQWRAARKQLETLGPSGSDSAVAEAALAQAEAAAAAARARSGYATIRAPATGVLIARNVEAGDTVQPGKVLMTLSPTGRTQLVVAIDEKNLHLLALGQKALAAADAYPQQRFAAELVYINPGINAQTGAVEVKLDVPAPPAALRQDMTVSVDIEVARRPGALVVPIDVVHAADGPAPWVQRVEDGRAVHRAVRLGLCAGGWCEVIANAPDARGSLRAGDRLVPVGAQVADGGRVRIAQAR